MICALCPRRCAALRTETAGEGFCAMPSAPVVARAMLHRWEEPCLSGTRGSGASSPVSRLKIAEERLLSLTSITSPALTR